MASFLWIVAGMVLVTYLPRALPLLVLSRMEVPAVVRQWLRFMPVAVLSALLAPALLLQQGHLAVSLDNSYLLAAIPTLFVAAKYKNILATVVCGILFLVVIRLVG